MALDDTIDTVDALRGSLACSVFELKSIYQERRPYSISEQVGSLCLKWDNIYLALCRYAMSTDCLENMSADEREIWRHFTYFEDGHTTSASYDNCLGNADGATDVITIEDWDTGTVYSGAFPLELKDQKKGFYRVWLGTDQNGNDIWEWKTMDVVPKVPEYCFDERALEPAYDVPKSYVYDSLDTIFYNIHECLPYNDCECKDYELMINDCNDVNNPIGPEDIYMTGCGSNYQGCSIVIEQRDRRRRR